MPRRPKACGAFFIKRSENRALSAYKRGEPQVSANAKGAAPFAEEACRRLCRERKGPDRRVGPAVDRATPRPVGAAG